MKLSGRSIYMVSVFFLSTMAFTACEKKNSESNQEQVEQKSVADLSLAKSSASNEFSYHIEPFFYSSDEAKTVTGLCIAYTKQMYDASEALKNHPDLKEGPCPDSSKIKEFGKDTSLDAGLSKVCEPYKIEQKVFAQLSVYDVSYDLSSEEKWVTSERVAQEHCEFQEPLSLVFLAE